MTRARAAALALVATLWMHASVATAEVFVVVVPEVDTAAIGEDFEVLILADFTEPILGFGIDIDFDPAVIDWADDPIIGDLWDPVFAPDGDLLAGLAPPTGLVGNDILLASLLFEGVGVGVTEINVSVTLDDLTEGFVLRVGGFDDFQVTPDDVIVPEPSSALLAVAALAVVAALRRRTARGGHLDGLDRGAGSGGACRPWRA